MSLDETNKCYNKILELFEEHKLEVYDVFSLLSHLMAITFLELERQGNFVNVENILEIFKTRTFQDYVNTKSNVMRERSVPRW